MTSSQNRADRLAHDLERFSVPTGTLAIWSLGHAGFALRWPDSGLVLLDPYLSGRIERLDPDTEFKRSYPPVLAPERLHADLVLITHRHDDHLDLDTLVPLSSTPEAPLIAAPQPTHQELQAHGLNRLHPLVAGKSFAHGPLTVTPIRAFHGDENNKLGPCFGFLMEAHGLRVCHTGDTLVTLELVETIRAYRPHVLIAPTNGADYFRTSRNIIGNMNGREAVELAHHVDADLLIPTHYDLFPNNSENQAFLVDYLLTHRPDQSFHLLRAGERFLYAAPGMQHLEP
ncbi:MBL fold metallo-hydrolase (plasmid) [Deinococcus radiomollis]|uniref:MBL fold metallo-hydrolase n=1 Tax=Deinococcus radiomollis TaxID=468916 RepID=UPI0038917081